MKTKTCLHCGNTFPATLDYFNRVGRNNPRLRTKCKECEKKYREDNQSHKREIDKAYRCANKEQIAKQKSDYYLEHKDQEIERYYRWKDNNADRLQEYQRQYTIRRKDKKKEYDKQYRDNNRPTILKRQKRWVKENIERVRMIGRAAAAKRLAHKKNAPGQYTPEDVTKQYKAQKGKCYYCGIKVGKTYHVDHVVPLSRGGSNGADNIVIACPHCNVTKNARLPHEWDKSGRLL